MCVGPRFGLNRKRLSGKTMAATSSYLYICIVYERAAIFKRERRRFRRRCSTGALCPFEETVPFQLQWTLTRELSASNFTTDAVARGPGRFYPRHGNLLRSSHKTVCGRGTPDGVVRAPKRSGRIEWRDATRGGPKRTSRTRALPLENCVHGPLSLPRQLFCHGAVAKLRHILVPVVILDVLEHPAAMRRIARAILLLDLQQESRDVPRVDVLPVPKQRHSGSKDPTGDGDRESSDNSMAGQLHGQADEPR